MVNILNSVGRITMIPSHSNAKNSQILRWLFLLSELARFKEYTIILVLIKFSFTLKNTTHIIQFIIN